ncbi:TonB-dependent receptor plug domain-containing protein [Duganella sp. P38]|uniref:TonB-dependent receptor plug domain-containing protein n=1 Tax=Duganella sp. P38 TaxID=3423949 RepID=UPI003D791F52
MFRLRHFALAASTLAVAGAVGAAEAAPPQAYAPAYFTQFQAGTAMDMATRLPGFVFDGGNPSRGAAGNVLINGKRPTSKTEGLNDVLGRIPAAAVERIEVINGGAGGIDMQGHATVANFVLKPMDLVSASLTAASYLMADGDWQPGLDGNYNLKRGDKSINLSLGWRRSPDTSQGQGQRTTQFVDRPQLAELAIAGAGLSESKTIKLNYAQELLDGELSWNGAYNPSTYQSQARQEAESSAIASNDNTVRTREQGLAYTRDLWPGASMDLKALYRSSDFSGDAGYASGGATSHSVTINSASEQILAGQLTWQALDGVTLRGGLERAVNANDSVNTWQPNAQAAAVPGVSAWVQESRVEGQLSSAWQVDSSLSAEAGLRLAHSSFSTSASQADGKAYIYPKPRLRLALSPTPALQLRLRLERDVSQLNFGDAAAYFGMADKSVRADYPDLVPAKTWLCEGAVEYRFWDRGAAILSYTQSHISDVIDRMPIRTAAATYDAAGNIGDASADSVTGMLNLPTDTWSLPQGLLKLSTTWRSSAVTDPTTQATRRLSGEQPLSWRLEFAQDLPQQRTAWGFSVDNGWNNDSWQVAERDTSSGSGWARAYINYRPASNMMLTLELNNLASRNITYDRLHYAGGDRYASNVDFLEHSVTRTQPYAMLRLRHEW